VTKSVVVSGVTFEQKCFVNDAMKLLMETKKLCTTAVEPLINRVDAAKQYGIGKVRRQGRLAMCFSGAMSLFSFPTL